MGYSRLACRLCKIQSIVAYLLFGDRKGNFAEASQQGVYARQDWRLVSWKWRRFGCLTVCAARPITCCRLRDIKFRADLAQTRVRDSQFASEFRRLPSTSALPRIPTRFGTSGRRPVMDSDAVRSS
jgi:hypothetical protein